MHAHLWLGLVSVALTGACGGVTSTPETKPGAATGASGGADAGSGGASGGAGGSATGGASSDGGGPTCGPPTATPKGRPTPVSCTATTATSGGPNAAPLACNVDADCPPMLGYACKGGVCTRDACIVDADCGPGSACICAGDFYGGNGGHGNVCVPANCRVDADCGPSGACEPSFSEYCGAPSGVYCHASADSCLGDTDCCETGTFCRYQPTLGHWACRGIVACSG